MKHLNYTNNQATDRTGKPVTPPPAEIPQMLIGTHLFIFEDEAEMTTFSDKLQAKLNAWADDEASKTEWYVPKQ
jgi:hypothetical protein